MDRADQSPATVPIASHMGRRMVSGRSNVNDIHALFHPVRDIGEGQAYNAVSLARASPTARDEKLLDRRR